jgi:hypothetical protein
VAPDVKQEFLEFHNLSGEEAERVWELKCRMERGEFRAPMGFVSQDVRYDSPIDGRPITNKHARIEDMKRSNCIEYDPGMKQDAERKRIEQETQLERSVDQTIERELATMPSRKLEKLTAELQGGLTVEPQRQTAPGNIVKPITR